MMTATEASGGARRSRRTGCVTLVVTLSVTLDLTVVIDRYSGQRPCHCGLEWRASGMHVKACALHSRDALDGSDSNTARCAPWAQRNRDIIRWEIDNCPLPSPCKLRGLSHAERLCDLAITRVSAHAEASPQRRAVGAQSSSWRPRSHRSA